MNVGTVFVVVSVIMSTNMAFSFILWCHGVALLSCLGPFYFLASVVVNFPFLSTVLSVVSRVVSLDEILYCRVRASF